jgi:hypothetical protein
MTPLRSFVLLLTFASLIPFTGCDSEPRTIERDTGVKGESVTLVRTLRNAIQAAMPDRPPEAVKSALNAMREQYREVLQATPLEEAAMNAGRFDDTDNLRRLEDLLNAAEKQNVPVNTVIRTMLADLEGGKLKGARLELTVRLLSHQLRVTPGT